ncbi:MAG: rhodanese-like domain-containing protein [Cytophagales bacterium]|nr:rhodanese-like domain-containing protein [Cytophagales bacterium]
MMELLKNLFGLGPKTNYSELLKNGAIIVDVRSKGEYAGGHIKGSVNIPVDSIGTTSRFSDKNKPIITCCASGMRSGVAKNILKSKGYTQVYNGGSWIGLQSKL